MNAKTLFSLLAVATVLTSCHWMQCGEWSCWHKHPIGPPPAHDHHGYVYEHEAVPHAPAAKPTHPVGSAHH